MRVARVHQNSVPHSAKKRPMPDWARKLPQGFNERGGGGEGDKKRMIKRNTLIPTSTKKNKRKKQSGGKRSEGEIGRG